MHAGVTTVQLAEQLTSRAENQACLNYLIAKLEKDLQCKEAALQIALEEVKARLIQLLCDGNFVTSIFGNVMFELDSAEEQT